MHPTLMARFFLLFLGLFVLGFTPTARANTGPWQGDNEAHARLVSATVGTGAEKTLSLGLEIGLGNGWHTYWRTPGDTGLPPEIDWSLSQTETGNLENATLLYPVPQRITAMDMDTIGYEDAVLFPLQATLRQAGQAAHLQASVQILICNTLCVPKHFDLTLVLPAGPATASPEAQDIQTALSRVPQNPDKASLRLTAVKRDTSSVSVTITAKDPLTTADLFVETPHNVAFQRPTLAIDKNNVTFTLRTAGDLPENVDLLTEPLTLTFVAGDQTLEQTVDKTFVPAAQETSKAVSSLGMILLFALLGGLILNLTPCVLPVLSLKIMGVIRHGGGEKHAVRRSFFMTAAGILFSFLLLASVLIVLKAAGQAIGWGIQFQHPGFLIFLCVVLTLFAANLWDLFEITLPRFIMDRLDPAVHPKLAGDFATGALAALLATPCSAPFLGTAVSFALAGSALHILTIFLALGIGLAAPYLLVGLWPQMATRLPRPGAWMITMRHILGGLLLLTIGWLLYVLISQIAWQGALFVLSCLGALFLALALRHRQGAGRWAQIVVILLLVAPFFAPIRTPDAAPQTAAQAMWRPFDPAAIDAYVKQGKVVFVNVGAEWCLTCKANSRFILSDATVAKRLFTDDSVIAMQADWTKPSPAITAFLKAHNRYGVPFDAVFGPGAPEGIVLPEILTPADVLNGLRDASKPKPCSTDTLAC